ncbi:MAG TPA: hemolysin family protein [Anaerolineaceae bacterium]|nr:hemolysin family protein [Anaerolineaceae bacterium]HOR83444.1 hemolysin family protein [Anaerolineaceae bacterium]HPL42852.1 hemolysin family protein [Anaerolineaceae bacterium]HQC21755.1 hemolysin family protein [Anaerolineaceae bacterium]
MPVYANILIIAVLFYFNGIFAKYEIAMVSARKTRLQQRSDDGNRGAADALELLKDPNQQYLSTIQIMITMIDTLAGGIGGAMLANPLAEVLQKVSWLAPAADTVALIFVVVVITYFSIVLGELIPKRIAVSKPEDVVCQLSPAIRKLTRLMRPLTRLLSTSTNLGIKLLRIDTQAEPSITEDEIKVFIEQGRDIGLIEQTESDMFSGIFRLGDRRVDVLMTPRTDLEWIDIEDDQHTIISELMHSEYSRIPVGRGSLDDVLGMVNVKELIGIDLHSPNFHLTDYIREPMFVPENMQALKVFEQFRATGTHQALVIDEYGGVQGMVTLYDVLEAIVGEIPLDSEDQEQEVVQRADGSYLLDGMLPIDEIKELLDFDELPDEGRAGYQTLSGFVMNQLGSIPRVGQTFTWDTYRFEVVDMDGRRVDKVLVMRLPEEAA